MNEPLSAWNIATRTTKQKYGSVRQAYLETVRKMGRLYEDV